ncbi:hypothetical protein PTKIN_Ptkin16aG0496400 [Pterospermum kingtungense]
MDERLRRAAREGNVIDLYELIEEDGNVLKRIDKVEFINTPLHVAADAGCIDFAMEIMSLKPSFARKLNQQGLKPSFALYVTTENQTALHIAVKNNKEKAPKVLCSMLRKTDYCEDVVNRKDRNGNTALHIAARDNRHKMIKRLLECKADKHATNQSGLTALDVAKEYNNRESIGEDRNALLVILGLLLTATFQASLSPPGGVWQGDSSSNSTVTGGNDGKEPGEQTVLVFVLMMFMCLAYRVSI